MRTSLSNDFRNQVLQSGNVLTQLIAINVGILLFTLFAGVLFTLFVPGNTPGVVTDFVSTYLGLPSNPLELILRPYSPISYMFVHAGFFHLLSNMITLLFAGRIFQEYLGNRKLLTTYILGGLAGGLVYFIGCNLIPFFKENSATYNVVGASGAVLAILVAAATLLPTYTIRLILIGSIQLRYIAIILVILDVLGLPNGNGGGHLTHLGGALFGFLYIKSLQNGRDLGAPLSRLFDKISEFRNPRPKSKTMIDYPKPMGNVRTMVPTVKANEIAGKRTQAQITQAEVDAILDKIGRSGYNSLTSHEREVLHKASSQL